MSKMSPAHPPEPVRLKFAFRLSPEWVDRHIVEHGTQPARDFEFEADLTEIEEPDLRRRFLVAFHRYGVLGGRCHLEAPTDDPEAIVEALESWLDGQMPHADDFGFELALWVTEHGSPRLRTAHKRGYKVNATYARERAALEFPAYWVDTNESALIKDRTDPSTDALAAETEALEAVEASVHDGLVTRVVWMLQPPADLALWLSGKYKKFSHCEAVRISGYLGRYSLYLPLPYPRGEE